MSTNTNYYRNEVRVPNLPIGTIVDKEGNPTQEELTFRQSLLSLLQSLIGNEGQVTPSVTTSQLSAIQDNTQLTPIGNSGTSGVSSYTCQWGTGAYTPSTTSYPSTPNDVLWSAYNNGSEPTTSIPVQGVVFKPIVALENFTIAGTSGASAGYVTVNFNGTLYKIQIYATS